LILTVGLFVISLGVCLASTWAFDGNLGPALAEDELDQMRGGYSGFYFGVNFNGYWDTVGNVSGSLVYGGKAPDISPALHDVPVVDSGSDQPLPNNGAVIHAYVGNFRGASGIFQISQSPGSNNIIQNNLTVQITLIRVATEAAVPALMNQLNLLWH
jgi:hypothetical protein